MKVYALFAGGVLLTFAIRRLRSDVVKFYEKEYIGERWETAKVKGYSIKPCTIKPMEKEK